MTDSSTSQHLQRPEDDDPLRVAHGRRLLREISDARKDVVATKADTSTIIELLTPTEENPVLTVLQQILTTQQQIAARIARIEGLANRIEMRLSEFERRLK
jgi:hypothetical protein